MTGHSFPGGIVSEKSLERRVELRGVEHGNVLSTSALDGRHIEPNAEQCGKGFLLPVAQSAQRTLGLSTADSLIVDRQFESEINVALPIGKRKSREIE